MTLSGPFHYIPVNFIIRWTFQESHFLMTGKVGMSWHRSQLTFAFESNASSALIYRVLLMYRTDLLLLETQYLTVYKCYWDSIPTSSKQFCYITCWSRRLFYMWNEGDVQLGAKEVIFNINFNFRNHRGSSTIRCCVIIIVYCAYYVTSYGWKWFFLPVFN